MDGRHFFDFNFGNKILLLSDTDPECNNSYLKFLFKNVKHRYKHTLSNNRKVFNRTFFMEFQYTLHSISNVNLS